MHRTLAILLVFAAPLLAQPRQPFPDDFKPSPCASAAPVCKTFKQSQFHAVAALRGLELGQEWVDAHWKELSEALAPACAKIATCFATNHFTFCNDVVFDEVYATTCNRYPEGSVEREKCGFFVLTYLTGHDRNSREPWEKIQECAKAQPPADGERTFEWWMSPATIGADYPGHFYVYTIDSETRVPVTTRILMDVKQPIYATEVASGLPTSFFKVPWKQPKLVRVPNAEGHRDVAPPEVRLEAPGYKTVTFRLPMDVPKMTVKMSPDPSKLTRGKNTVTITAVDAATGEPVEARVMGGHAVLGKTNVPFELEVVKGQKRPEIWVTSLYDRYSDVVVAPAER
jgi:hypothetical protein